MPKVFLRQILWHSKDNKRPDRVYCIDWQKYTKKIASCGADEFIHIWEVSFKPDLVLQCLARLIGHESEVNAVRWNPQGALLASGGTDKNIFIWKRSDKPENLPVGYDASITGVFPEYWSRVATSRCTDAVNTLCWSPGGTQIAAALEDFKVMIFSLNEVGLSKSCVLEGHTNMVQGICWDPLNEYIASQSCDQSLRVWSRKLDGKNWKLENVIRSVKDKQPEEPRFLPSDSDSPLPSPPPRVHRPLFYPESILPTFFRRLDWSPDGSILVAPGGIQYLSTDDDLERPSSGGSETSCVHYIFHRKLLPLSPLPFVTQQSTVGVPVVIRFSPITYKRVPPPPAASHYESRVPPTVLQHLQAMHSWVFRASDIKEEGGVEAPRFVYAVGTSVGHIMLYDTQHFGGPIAAIRNVHLAAITDLAWTDDGYGLAVSSSDGCVTFVWFSVEELGEPVWGAGHYGVQEKGGEVVRTWGDVGGVKNSYLVHSKKEGGNFKIHASEGMFVVGNACDDIE